MGFVQAYTENIKSQFSHIACVVYSNPPTVILTMHMCGQFIALFLPSRHGRCKCGTHFTNIDPTAMTIQAVSGAMFPSGVHCQYLQNISFGNQPIFFFWTFCQSATCMFQINVKGLLHQSYVSWCVVSPVAALVLVELQSMWENDKQLFET